MLLRRENLVYVICVTRTERNGKVMEERGRAPKKTKMEEQAVLVKYERICSQEKARLKQKIP